MVLLSITSVMCILYLINIILISISDPTTINSTARLSNPLLYVIGVLTSQGLKIHFVSNHISIRPKLER